MSIENESKNWRDAELKASDWVFSVGDHPEREMLLEYREALRNWPATEDFPHVRPMPQSPLEIPEEGPLASPSPEELLL